MNRDASTIGSRFVEIPDDRALRVECVSQHAANALVSHWHTTEDVFQGTEIMGHIVLDIRPSRRNWELVVICDGAPGVVFGARSLVTAERFLARELFAIIRRICSTEAMFIHAAAVAKENKLFVMYGRTRSGKSTLAVELHNRGGEFYSDDTILITRGDMRIARIPKLNHMRQDNGSVALLPRPETIRYAFSYTNFKCYELNQYPDSRQCDSFASVEVIDIEYTPGCRPSLEPMDRGAFYERFALSVFDFTDDVVRNCTLMKALYDQCHAVRFRVGDLKASADLLESYHATRN